MLTRKEQMREKRVRQRRKRIKLARFGAVLMVVAALGCWGLVYLIDSAGHAGGNESAGISAGAAPPGKSGGEAEAGAGSAGKSRPAGNSGNRAEPSAPEQGQDQPAPGQASGQPPAAQGQGPSADGPDSGGGNDASAAESGNTSGPSAVPAAGSDPAAANSAATGEARVNMAFVGDVLFGGKVAPLLEKNGYDYPYRKVADLLQTPDLTVGNLETPVTTRGEPEDKEWVYRSSPDALPAMREAGFDVVNLANNHVRDYGAVGLLDTLKYLQDAQIAHVGAGADEEEAFRPVLIEKNGIKIAFLGFSHVVPDADWKARPPSAQEPDGNPGVAPTYDYRKPVAAIEQAARQADLVVVIAHWGEEREDTPADDQVELAHRYIDAGADLVVGGHPHVLQSFEHYKGKWIAYSLGNFIFTTNDMAKTWDSLIMQASCDKEGGCAIQLVPIYTKWAQPEVMEAAQGKALMKRLDDLSAGVDISADGKLSPEVKKP